MNLLSNRKLHLAAAGLVGVIAVISLASIGGCLNPAFVNQVAGGSVVPLAPGDTPFVHVLIINATQAKAVDFQVGWTPSSDIGAPTAFIGNIYPRQQQGLVLDCPVNQIGLGNPNNLNAPAVVVREGTLTYNIPASAFPLILAKGRDFNCGDTVVFTIIDSRSNGYGIEILPGHVDGATQQGPFSGPDTFEILRALYTATGTPPTPIP